MKKTGRKAEGIWGGFCAWIEKHESLVWILIVMTVLRIPSLFEPDWYGDEQIYLALGEGWRQGLTFYKDIFDHKPPGIYWLAGLSGGILGFKLMLMISNTAGIILAWKIGLRLWVKKKAALISALVFGLFTTLPLLEGNIVNAELFMIVPAMAGVNWLLQNPKRTEAYFWIGLLFGIALLFKVPIATDFVGVGLWFFIYKEFSWSKLWRWVVDKRFWVMGVGFLLPIVLSGVLFTMAGAGLPYLQAVLGFNVGYVTAWQGGDAPLIESGMFQRSVVLMGLLLVIFAGKKWLGDKVSLLLIWIGFSIFGVTLPGRPYGHYWIQAIPAFALILGGLVIAKERKRVVVATIVASSLIALGIWRYDLWKYPVVSYYQNFGEWLIGKQNKEEYYDYFGPVNRNAAVAEYIRVRTERGDEIFVWGTEPNIYVMSKRVPVGKYTVAFHIKDFDAFWEVLDQIKTAKPKFIVVMDYEDDFEGLQEYLDLEYIPVERIEEAIIYRLI